ncbi:MAG: response regulator [Alphaproteobacteria bacterium]|uniref:histidine kinase n=1 Tax=Candidatus Nitrobium versatile TaxID=2884831 RepID=A0A953JE61_9BACT|nr:response regulator [Candidatus Nitrobium versatile]
MNGESRGSILVVDDDPFVLDSASLLLGSYGNSVVSSPNGREALSHFKEGTFDVVVTDIKMPSMSGIELLEQIRSLDPQVPVILMTAYADLDIAIDAVKKGAYDFIVKPYKPEQLIHSVEKAVKYNRLVRMETEYRRILEEFNQELETLVAERTMSLMALTVADRVRNPASTIGGTGKRLLEKEELPERAREGLKSIVDEAEKLDVIVRDFQEILKTRKSMFRYEDINAIVKNLLSLLVKEIEDRGISLEVCLTENPLRINAQKNLLRVAIFHVLRNAIEATPEGGTISVTTAGSDSRVTLTVSDTGRGIPEQDIPRIFDPFFSTKDHKFGMGLPLVRQIVTEHLGEITVESRMGTGTTFRMSFPARWMEKSTMGGKHP